jgi:hypothetical protein
MCFGMPRGIARYPDTLGAGSPKGTPGANLSARCTIMGGRSNIWSGRAAHKKDQQGERRRRQVCGGPPDLPPRGHRSRQRHLGVRTREYRAGWQLGAVLQPDPGGQRNSAIGTAGAPRSERPPGRGRRPCAGVGFSIKSPDELGPETQRADDLIAAANRRYIAEHLPAQRARANEEQRQAEERAATQAELDRIAADLVPKGGVEPAPVRWISNEEP